MPRVQTAFAERLGIDMPILGFSHSTDVTAAITKAGGLGVYGIAHDPPDTVGARVRQQQLVALAAQPATAAAKQHHRESYGCARRPSHRGWHDREADALVIDGVLCKESAGIPKSPLRRSASARAAAPD